MIFGQKLRKLREEKGVTQQELAEKLGYVTNSYVSDVEKGAFIPSRGKLKKIAEAFKISFKKLEDMLIDSKIEALGIREPQLRELFKEVPKLPENEKRAIIKVYLSLKEKRRKKKAW